MAEGGGVNGVSSDAAPCHTVTEDTWHCTAVRTWGASTQAVTDAGRPMCLSRFNRGCRCTALMWVAGDGSCVRVGTGHVGTLCAIPFRCKPKTALKSKVLTAKKKKKKGVDERD